MISEGDLVGIRFFTHSKDVIVSENYKVTYGSIPRTGWMEIKYLKDLLMQSNINDFNNTEILYDNDNSILVRFI